MTDQTKTNIFLLNWLACSAAIITVIVLSLNVTKVARNHVLTYQHTMEGTDQ